MISLDKAFYFDYLSSDWSTVALLGGEGSSNAIPPSRAFHALALHSTDHYCVLQGGLDLGTNQVFRDVWLLDLQKMEWTQLRQQIGGSFASTAVQYQHVMLHDPTRNQFIIHGGITATGTISSAVRALTVLPAEGRFSTATQTNSGSLMPPALFGHTAILFPNRYYPASTTNTSILLLIGGWSSLNNYTLATTGYYLQCAGRSSCFGQQFQLPLFAQRAGHSAVFNPISLEVHLIGGSVSVNSTIATLFLPNADQSNWRWRSIDSRHSPTPLFHSTLTAFRALRNSGGSEWFALRLGGSSLPFSLPPSSVADTLLSNDFDISLMFVDKVAAHQPTDDSILWPSITMTAEPSMPTVTHSLAPIIQIPTNNLAQMDARFPEASMYQQPTDDSSLALIVGGVVIPILLLLILLFTFNRYIHNANVRRVIDRCIPGRQRIKRSE